MDTGHQIASRAAMQMIREAVAAGLPWSEVAIAAETVVAIAASACATMSGSTRQADFIKEVIETITERAHSRVIEYLTGEKP